MKKIILFISLFLIISCHKETKNIDLSVYYWKTNLNFSIEEKNFLSEKTERYAQGRKKG